MGHARRGLQPGSDHATEGATDPLHGIPYLATKLLGEGGTALVYEARPRAGGRRVAVKMLRPSLAASDSAVERMRIEAESLSCLDHPNIVRVFDFGRAPNGCPYLVEERLYGRSLHKEIVARGPLPVLEAIEYVCQVLGGLEVVHRRGIVHRDLKLGNLFLVRNKELGKRLLKMLDFGFAKVLRIECSRERPKPMSLSTAGDMFVGTPRFAAPEQVAAGYSLGPSADLYTVGLVLYSLLAGREPFCEIARETDVLMAQVQQDLGSPARHSSEPIAAELEAFLNKAVAKHPENRFTSATEMKEALESLRLRLRSLEESPGESLASARPPRPDKSGRIRTDPHACTTVRWDAASLAELANDAQWASETDCLSDTCEAGADAPDTTLSTTTAGPAAPEPPAATTPPLAIEPSVSTTTPAAFEPQPSRASTSTPHVGARDSAAKREGVVVAQSTAAPTEPRARALHGLAVALGILLSLATILWLVWRTTSGVR